MIERLALRELRRRMSYFPGVVLLGPRQVGKSTLARTLAAERPGSIVLDMERAADRAQLAEPELFLSRHRDKLVVLDEVQLMPELFSHLRPEIDADRRAGRFLLLGSASGTLLQQGSESLAGRVSYLELTPLLAAEAAPTLSGLQSLWLHGGFPLSHLAPDEALSYQWRQDFIESFLYRDLPQMGVGLAAEALHRFWRMQAHLQGQLFNASQLGVSLGGMAHTTVARYLDTLVDAMVLRRLPPHLANVGKRLVKTPKVYVRDSGLLHALLGIADLNALQGHPIVGASWEGFVIEQIAAALPAGAELGFYRTAAGAELDAVVSLGQSRIGIEIKFSAAPKVSRGFWTAAHDLQLDKAVVLAPVERAYPLGEGAEVLPISALTGLLQRG